LAIAGSVLPAKERAAGDVVGLKPRRHRIFKV
jgi:hypothetical protein